MGFTLIDYFNGFQALNGSRHFSAGVQATYYAILAEFNRQRYPEQVTLSTRDLQSRAGLKSVSTTHEARNVLKNNRLVDFHTIHGTTVYRLGSEHLQNSDRTTAEHAPNDFAGSYIRPRVEAKKEDLDRYAQSRAREVDELIEHWERSGGSKLNFTVLSELDALVAKHGAQALKRAITAACTGNNSRYGFSLNYVKLKLAEILKGDDNHEKRFDYEDAPATDWIKPYC